MLFDADGGDDPWKCFVEQCVGEMNACTMDLFTNQYGFVAKVGLCRERDGTTGAPLWEYVCGHGDNDEEAVRAALRRWGIRSERYQRPGMPAGVSHPVAGHAVQPGGMGMAHQQPAMRQETYVVQPDCGDIGMCRQIKKMSRIDDGCLWPGLQPASLDPNDPPEWYDMPVKWYAVGKKPITHGSVPAGFETTPAKMITWRQYTEQPLLRWKLESFVRDPWYCPDVDKINPGSEVKPDSLAKGYRLFLQKALACLGSEPPAPQEPYEEYEQTPF